MNVQRVLLKTVVAVLALAVIGQSPLCAEAPPITKAQLDKDLAAWLRIQLEKKDKEPFYENLPTVARQRYAAPACPCCSDRVPAESKKFPGFCHPYMQPGPNPETATGRAEWFQETTTDQMGPLTVVITPESDFPEPVLDPFKKPPGTNMLPTIYTNMFDGNGIEIPNTLPSTKEHPYHLHGDPTVTEIDKTSPTDDLQYIFNRIQQKSALVVERAQDWIKVVESEGLPSVDNQNRIRGLSTQIGADLDDMAAYLEFAVDILEGNQLDIRVKINSVEGRRIIDERAYEGFPLLHYNGPEKIKRVSPRYDDKGQIVGGNVDIHQIWYDSHIASDTALLNPVDVWDVPWTITYTVDVLNRGHDDFSPFLLLTDDPSRSGIKQPKPQDYGPNPVAWPAWGAGQQNVGMDQTFFPMEDGTRTVYKINMPPAKYWNMTYTWGWRMHPPRIQTTDRATKAFPDPDNGGRLKTLVQWETDVFTTDPRKNKTQAIGKIGNLSPEKTMWNLFGQARGESPAINEAFNGANNEKDPKKIVAHLKALIDTIGKAAGFVSTARTAFRDWQDRSRLPSNVMLGGVPIRETDFYKQSDIVLLYVNNTIYAELTQGGLVRFPDWKKRSKLGSVAEVLAHPTLRVGLLNGDYFSHGYVNVDFGGMRGWENQFKPTTSVGGSGCWFTFGRAHWSVNNPVPVFLPAAKPEGDPTQHRVHFTYRYEPSRRLRFYQFDPIHHDVAIYSIH